MPVHGIADTLSHVPTSSLLKYLTVGLGCYGVKIYVGGRKCSWERDWAGKMIIIVALPTPTTLSLIHHLLHLPIPPQILFLPPLESPLPEELLTILHTIRLGLTSPLAQLHAEALPRTPSGVRDFIRKWGTVPQGTAGQDGRRVDAVVLGQGWEVGSLLPSMSSSSEKGKEKESPWTIHQFQFHFLTSLLPYLLRAPAERNIRIISLVSPGFSASLPTLQGKAVRSGPLQDSARRGITSLLLWAHFQLILNTLAAATYGKSTPVPDPNDATPSLKRNADGVKSNIMALSVIMPWTRDEVWRPLLGIDEAWWRWILWCLLYPFVLILTPSPSKSIQSVLYALCAPVRYEDPTPEHREKGVGGGDVIRNCHYFELPPVLQDPALAKANYEALEKEVEKRVKAEQYKPNPTSTASSGPTAPNGHAKPS